jgi:hypothetical protein
MRYLPHVGGAAPAGCSHAALHLWQQEQGTGQRTSTGICLVMTSGMQIVTESTYSSRSA